MKQKELKDELMNLIDKKSQFEIEIVERYLDLVKTYRRLNKSIKNFGDMIEVRNGAQTFVKVNSAIAEKNKINQQLIKLGEFFIKKKEALENSKSNTNFADPSKFL
ncbi:MAG: P27 family phage terminase small subunit [Streptococcus orisratti]|uniref:P27 family phage terminase small subunit n=1 Tax=Streptococcus orisratti TaxID=114652 RepID=UPI002A8F6B18|nr:P27 family phage terminase small subunit [Streptococcus orisratti]MDY4001010.1 P27 family phage terminase small subunit [Streptococcus orisratti]MDY5635270.1 P27 family phage terminase small subunit [Streptococcus orisratti]